MNEHEFAVRPTWGLQLDDRQWAWGKGLQLGGGVNTKENVAYVGHLTVQTRFRALWIKKYVDNSTLNLSLENNCVGYVQGFTRVDAKNQHWQIVLKKTDFN